MNAIRTVLVVSVMLTMAVCITPYSVPAVEVFTVLSAGYPSLPDSLIDVQVHVRGNSVHRVGAYSLVVVWPAEALTYVTTLHGSSPFSPGIGPAFGEGHRQVSAFAGEITSYFRNGYLFTMRFRTTAAVAGNSYSVRIAPYGEHSLFTPRPGRPIAVTKYDSSETTGLSSGPELAMGGSSGAV